MVGLWRETVENIHTPPHCSTIQLSPLLLFILLLINMLCTIGCFGMPVALRMADTLIDLLILKKEGEKIMKKFSVMAVIALAMVSVSGVFANGGQNTADVNSIVQNDTVKTKAAGACCDSAACDSVACDTSAVAK